MKIGPANTGTWAKGEGRGARGEMEVGEGSGNSHWQSLEGRDALDLEEENCIFLQQLEPGQPHLFSPAKQEPS